MNNENVECTQVADPLGTACSTPDVRGPSDEKLYPAYCTSSFYHIVGQNVFEFAIYRHRSKSRVIVRHVKNNKKVRAVCMSKNYDVKSYWVAGLSRHTKSVTSAVEGEDS